MTWLTAVCAALLVDMPIAAAAYSAWWATTGLLHLGHAPSLALGLALAALALWGIVLATRLAIETRMDGDTP